MQFKRLIAAILGSAVIIQVYADTYVKGYFRKNGTYVQPHMRSSRDSNFSNNWSTYGNVNPYTGRTGDKTSPTYSYPSTYPSISYPQPSLNYAPIYSSISNQASQPIMAKNAVGERIKLNGIIWNLNMQDISNLSYFAERNRKQGTEFPVISIMYIRNISETGNPIWLVKKILNLKYDCRSDSVAVLSEGFINSKNEIVEDVFVPEIEANDWKTGSDYLNIERLKKLTPICDEDQNL